MSYCKPSNFERVYLATLGVELTFISKEDCLMLASSLDYNLTLKEERRLGAAIWNRTSRGVNGADWLVGLYKAATELNLVMAQGELI